MDNWKRCIVATLSLAAFISYTCHAAEDRAAVLKRREAVLKRLYDPTGLKQNVSASDGQYLKILAESIRARRVLELGSGEGYSALHLGIALEKAGGHLWTIEIDPTRAQECRNNIKEAGLDSVVTCIEADALKAIPKIEGEFDLVFIDAYKPDFLEYFETIFPRVRDGGMIVAHNAFKRAGEMKSYLDTVMHHPQLDSVFLLTATDPTKPMEDGFCISVKKKEE